MDADNTAQDDGWEKRQPSVRQTRGRAPLDGQRRTVHVTVHAKRRSGALPTVRLSLSVFIIFICG